MKIFSDRYIYYLLIIFLITIPFINPYLRGDGNGYYAYIRSIIIDRDLEFSNEYERANLKFKDHPSVWKKTPTGLTQNQYPVGSLLLWSPFFLSIYLVTKVLNLSGFKIPSDGYSPPYLWLVAFGSAFYAFIGLLLIYSICREYFHRDVVLLSIVLIWFASSLPVYMYLLPFYAHANALFTTSLFIFVWIKTRGEKNKIKWFILGITGGLMVLVRYESAVFLLIPLLGILTRIRKSDRKFIHLELIGLGVFCIGLLAALTPNFIIKKLLYGSFLETGYGAFGWLPSFKIFFVLFSSKHGIFIWTPILLFATGGFPLFFKKDKKFAFYLAIPYILLVYIVSSQYNWWQGSSFGGRIFISCTPLFVLGLSALIESLRKKIPLKVISIIGLFFIVWNFLFIFQFGWGLIPREDYISWKKIVYNQIFVVPSEIIKIAKIYLFEREDFKVLIEDREAVQREKGLQY